MRVLLSISARLLAVVLLLSGCSKNYEKVVVQPQAESGAVTEGSVDTNYHHRLSDGLALLEAGDYNAAIETFQVIRNSEDSNWRLYLYLGLAYLGRGDCAISREMYQQALTRVGDDRLIRSDIYCQIGWSWEVEGDLGQARLSYHMAQNLDPDSNSARSALLRLNRTSSR